MLDKNEYEYLINLLYRSNEIQTDHGTDWTDKFHIEELRSKMTEILRCKHPNHKECKIMYKLVEMLKQLK